MNAIAYDSSSILAHIKPKPQKQLTPELLAARDEMRRDVGLMAEGRRVPKAKQPLDAGFIEWPKRLLEEDAADRRDSQIAQITRVGSDLRDELDRVVLLGIGGSYMGARALFESLCHPYHNELEMTEREGIPRFYFEGNNLDNDVIQGLLELLSRRCRNRTDLRQRWGIVVISKSGGTLETAVAFRIFRQALEEFYGADSRESRRYVVPITGAEGRLRTLAERSEYPHVFSIPEGIGGRFSVLTPVGLVPAALMGLDIRRLLRGAADLTEQFFTADPGANPTFDYTAACHLAEKHLGLSTRVLSTWGKRLESLGLWYDQLLSESLGKDEQGATPITVVNTRDLHSRGQQHQEGTRDKLITNLIVSGTSAPPLSVPRAVDDTDQLNRFSKKTVPELLRAAIEGTNKAYADDNRPTADITVPILDEYVLGQLFQMFMLATVLEGRLLGINPYGQPGVEDYKRNMTEILSR